MKLDPNDPRWKRMRAMADPGIHRMHMEGLLGRIRARLPELEGLRDRFHAWEEDGVYRFYHGSFKVFRLQSLIQEALKALQEIAGETDPLAVEYLRIVEPGIAHPFSETTNENWEAETRPILEAFRHTKYFLEMMVKNAKVEDPITPPIDSGWASILYLFQMR